MTSRSSVTTPVRGVVTFAATRRRRAAATEEPNHSERGMRDEASYG